MINPIRVADERVGDAAKIEESIPVGIVARQARDFEAKHEADVTERDLGRHPGKTRAFGQARAGETEILVEHKDALAWPAEPDGTIDELILSRGRLAIMLYLVGAGLTHVDDGAAAQMIVRDFRGLTFEVGPPVGRLLWRSVGRAGSRSRRVVPRRASARPARRPAGGGSSSRVICWGCMCVLLGCGG